METVKRGIDGPGNIFEFMTFLGVGLGTLLNAPPVEGGGKRSSGTGVVQRKGKSLHGEPDRL